MYEPILPIYIYCILYIWDYEVVMGLSTAHFSPNERVLQGRQQISVLEQSIDRRIELVELGKLHMTWTEIGKGGHI